MQRLIDDNATSGDFLYPMIRGRVVEVNGQEARAYQTETTGFSEGPRLTSERNLTWTAAQPDNNYCRSVLVSAGTRV